MSTRARHDSTYASLAAFERLEDLGEDQETGGGHHRNGGGVGRFRLSLEWFRSLFAHISHGEAFASHDGGRSDDPVWKFILIDSK